MRIWRTCLLGIFLFQGLLSFYIQPIRGQGIPFIRNYKTDEYKAHQQNWSIMQDQNGVMYSGNTTHLLSFDGKYWQGLQLPNHSPVRSLAIDTAGTIYAGGINEFGYIGYDRSGKWCYRSLSDRLPEADRNFSNVWAIHDTGEGLYFITRKKVFRFIHNKLEKIDALNNMMPFRIKNGIILNRSPEGLSILIRKQQYLLPHTDSLFSQEAGRTIILPYTDHKILIITQNNGLFSYDIKPLLDSSGHFIENFSAQPFSDALLQKLPGNAESLLRNSSPYQGVKINDDCYAIATINNGIFLLNQQGEVTQVLNKKTGLRSNTVWNLYKDRDQNLWAALNNGIAYIEINSLVTLFDERNGLDAYPSSMIEHQGNFYVTNMSGVYYLSEIQQPAGNKERRFLPVKNAEAESWGMISINNTLLAGGHGILRIKDFAAAPEKINNFIYCFGASTRFPGYVFLGMREGLAAAKLPLDSAKAHQDVSSGKLEVVRGGHFKKVNDIVRKMVSDRDGNLWLTSSIGGIIYIRFRSSDISDFDIYRYDTRHGLPQQNWNWVHYIDHRLLIGTQRGIYQAVLPEDFPADPGQIKFVSETRFGRMLIKRNVDQMTLDKQHNIWVSTDSGLVKLLKQPDGHYIWSDIPFKKIRNVTDEHYLTADGRFWISAENGLYCFDTRRTRNYKNDYPTMIRKVATGEDSILFHGNYGNPAHTVDEYFTSTLLTQPLSWQPRLSYQQNCITFKYAATFYEHGAANQFQYILEGFDRHWSHWSTMPQKEYTNLPEGEYCFRVKAKNIFEQESREAVYRFSIMPPWYRSELSYIGYALILFGLFYGIVWFNTRRLIAAKRRLEKTVAERTTALDDRNRQLTQSAEALRQKNQLISQKTEELQKRNEQITSQSEELREKNKQITSSIHYAKDIQESILPREERIAASLSHYFILYLPRDIVSGDFYWYHQLNGQVVIAAVDCTGHGVPGAFMSIIGNRLLDEVVCDQQEYNPARILAYLHQGVRTALKQDMLDTKNRDGMDVCICVFDAGWQWLDFAGARRPLYLARTGKEGGKLIEVKGDRKSIGGKQKESQRTFEKQRISIQRGDNIYLTSDGFMDQDNPEGQKFGHKRFKTLLQSTGQLDIADQKQMLLEALAKHQGSSEQRDDITIIGIRV